MADRRRAGAAKSDWSHAPCGSDHRQPGQRQHRHDHGRAGHRRDRGQRRHGHRLDRRNAGRNGAGLQQRLELHADVPEQRQPHGHRDASRFRRAQLDRRHRHLHRRRADRPAAPTITSPASGSTDTTTAEPAIAGTGVSGDTVTVSIDGTQVGTAPVSNSAWSYTPTSLSNASHTVTATQAAAGGPSSTAATDTFTVNVSGGGRTISSAITGPLTLAATNNPLTITSAGSITTTASGDAVSGGSGTIWQIINAGTISGTIGSSSAGIYLQSAGSTVQNTGKIYGATAGIWLSDGGDVTNSAIGLITATGNYGVYIGGGPGVVTNAGTITGGWYAVDFATSSSANLLTVDPGAVFNGAVNGNGGVLELTAGSGSIGLIGSSAFSGFETLSDDGSALWTLTGANTIADVTDNGGLTIAGSLDVSAAVGAASTGQFDLQTGSSLEVAADTAAHSQVDFLGASQLTIDNAALFGTGVGGSSYAGPLLENFAAGDTIDLHGFMTAAAALLYNPANGLLQITNGASQLATVDFQNSTLGTGSFSFASDGNGGTLIKHRRLSIRFGP